MSEPNYSSSSSWEDVVPIVQDDPPHALASIAYPDRYSEAMSYLRAVMAVNEISERVLDLTEDIISMNAAHYTVWLYRAQVILALSERDEDHGVARMQQEIQWLNPIALKNQKNYQIWQHRQVIIDRLNLMKGEVDFIMQMFSRDTKNYHVWSYRQWLVQRFDLWDKGEMESIEKMLEEDVRNNSAWNHRWFLVFGRPDGQAWFEDPAVIKRESEFAQNAIRVAPQNQSPWNYLGGLTRRVKGPAASSLEPLTAFAMEFAPLDHPDRVRSSHALDFIASRAVQGDQSSGVAIRALELLETKLDPIRAQYWRWRKATLLGETGVTSSEQVAVS